jgi:hypothetical protein
MLAKLEHLEDGFHEVPKDHGEGKHKPKEVAEALKRANENDAVG